MKLFGNWRFTKEPVQVESEKVKDLHKLLVGERKARLNAAKIAEKKKIRLEKEIDDAKTTEAKRIHDLQSENKAHAIIHLRAAERYENMMDQSTGARRAELRAIVTQRTENAEKLGFKLTGSISHTIMHLT